MSLEPSGTEQRPWHRSGCHGLLSISCPTVPEGRATKLSYCMRVDKCQQFMFSLVWLLLSGVPHVYASAPEAPKETYRSLCSRAVQFLEHDSLDSAFYYFARAYKSGMPADSLYYFWGEVYAARGVYDSALALNYAIGETSGRRFEQRVFEQRLAIFRALGWEEQAGAVEDSLMGYPGFVTRFFIPDLTLSAAAGWRRSTELVDTTYPWGNPGGPPREEDNRYSARGKVRLRWPLAFIPRDRLWVGIEGGIARPYAPDSTFVSRDSLEYGFVASIEASRLADRFYAGYSLGIREDEFGDRYLSHQLSASLVASLGHVPLLLSLGYSLQDSLDGGVLYHSFWAYGSADVLNRGRSRLSVSLIGSGLVGDASVDVYDTVEVLYAERTDGARPIFYTDEAYSTMIDTMNLDAADGVVKSLARMHYLEEVNDNAHGVHISRMIPQKSARVSPAVVYRHDFRPGPCLELATRWELAYYPEEFSWVTALPEAGGDSYAVRDRSGTWYYVDNRLNTVDPVSERATGVPVESHEARRVDNTIGATVSLEKELRPLGTIGLSGTVFRTWSSLPPNAPVDVPERGGGVRLSWEKEFSVR